MTSYEDFFERATGRPPYDYQRELATELPSVLEVPTGSGKTHALIVSWLYQRRVRSQAPRRLVYALPMRTLVEQTAEAARAVRDGLGLAAEDLPVHVLMGGEATSDWRERPEQDQILVGTENADAAQGTLAHRRSDTVRGRLPRLRAQRHTVSTDTMSSRPAKSVGLRV